MDGMKTNAKKMKNPDGRGDSDDEQFGQMEGGEQEEHKQED